MIVLPQGDCIWEQRANGFALGKDLIGIRSSDHGFELASNQARDLSHLCTNSGLERWISISYKHTFRPGW